MFVTIDRIVVLGDRCQAASKCPTNRIQINFAIDQTLTVVKKLTRTGAGLRAIFPGDINAPRQEGEAKLGGAGSVMAGFDQVLRRRRRPAHRSLEARPLNACRVRSADDGDRGGTFRDSNQNG